METLKITGNANSFSVSNNGEVIATGTYTRSSKEVRGNMKYNGSRIGLSCFGYWADAKQYILNGHWV